MRLNFSTRICLDCFFLLSLGDFTCDVTSLQQHKVSVGVNLRICAFFSSWWRVCDCGVVFLITVLCRTLTAALSDSGPPCFSLAIVLDSFLPCPSQAPRTSSKGAKNGHANGFGAMASECQRCLRIASGTRRRQQWSRGKSRGGRQYLLLGKYVCPNPGKRR